MRRPDEFNNWPDALPYSFGPYRAVVQYVVDGDTLDVLIDAGFNEYRYIRVRLLAVGDGGKLRGVNAPEKNRAESKEQGLAAMAWVQQQLPLGMKVSLVTQADSDEFGRYLAAIQLQDGRDLGTELVASGHAVYKDY